MSATEDSKALLERLGSEEAVEAIASIYDNVGVSMLPLSTIRERKARAFRDALLTFLTGQGTGTKPGGEG